AAIHTLSLHDALPIWELPAAALKEYTQVIIGEADRLTALVDSMAGPSRAPSKTELNVHEICEHVYHLVRAEAPSGVVIERDYDRSEEHTSELQSRGHL